MLPAKAAAGSLDFMLGLAIDRVWKAADVSLTADLAERIWREHYIPIIGETQVRYMLDKFQSPEAVRTQMLEGYEYYLVREEGRAMGYFALQRRGRAELFLSKMYLLPACRGKGFGKACFDFIEQRARELGAAEIVLTVNKHNAASIAAYERWGLRRSRGLVIDIGGGFRMDDWEYRCEVARGD